MYLQAFYVLFNVQTEDLGLEEKKLFSLPLF